MSPGWAASRFRGEGMEEVPSAATAKELKPSSVVTASQKGFMGNRSRQRNAMSLFANTSG